MLFVSITLHRKLSGPRNPIADGIGITHMPKKNRGTSGAEKDSNDPFKIIRTVRCVAGVINVCSS